MNNLWVITIVYSMMWLSVGAAVFYAIYVTNSITPLWFFILPLVGVSILKSTFGNEGKGGS